MSIAIWFLCLLGLCDFDKDVYYSMQEDAKAKSIEAELSRVTRLLCEAGKVIRGGNVASPELLRWFNEHDEVDRKAGRHE